MVNALHFVPVFASTVLTSNWDDSHRQGMVFGRVYTFVCV